MLPYWGAKIQTSHAYYWAVLRHWRANAANIINKNLSESTPSFDEALLVDNEEVALYQALKTSKNATTAALKARDYDLVLSEIAKLREPVDAFFDNVMVMADDVALRQNRLALLVDLRAIFECIADISRLAVK